MPGPRAAPSTHRRRSTARADTAAIDSCERLAIAGNRAARQPLSLHVRERQATQPFPPSICRFPWARVQSSCCRREFSCWLILRPNRNHLSAQPDKNSTVGVKSYAASRHSEAYHPELSTSQQVRSANAIPVWVWRPPPRLRPLFARFSFITVLTVLHFALNAHSPGDRNRDSRSSLRHPL
jgi:hypothetical protein